LVINLETAELTTKYRKNQLFPTVNVFGGYGLRGSHALQAIPPADPSASWSLALDEIEEQSAPNSVIGVLFSVPLTRTAERANYRASKELEKQAELLLKQKEELVLREVADAISFAHYSYARCESAKKAVAFAAEALDAEEQKVQLGTGSISFVLQAQTDLARAQTSELTARRDYNRALSQLYFAEGTLLQRGQFELTFN
jgi:outer membrane protein TolC